jgi:hypothetical protein
MRDPAEEGRRWLKQAVRLAGEVVEMVRARIPKQKEAP